MNNNVELEARKIVDCLSRKEIAKYIEALSDAIEDEYGEYETGYCSTFLGKAAYEIERSGEEEEKNV